MRTTLDIADDVLMAAKEIARREKRSIGEVVSDLIRKSFQQASESASEKKAPLGVSERMAVYGIHPLPARGSVVSNELVNRIRDIEGI